MKYEVISQEVHMVKTWRHLRVLVETKFWNFHDHVPKKWLCLSHSWRLTVHSDVQHLARAAWRQKPEVRPAGILRIVSWMWLLAFLGILLKVSSFFLVSCVSDLDCFFFVLLVCAFERFNTVALLHSKRWVQSSCNEYLELFEKKTICCVLTRNGVSPKGSRTFPQILF